ncbi:hypothetical protein BO82DRAFT_434049 [Aspergillus uvarum CBS 121591]|uniref:Uncharacterized protein n=1 Tax=Aspergillus uvarum CBS 121591 TaxID=1448315 RepID=A0A319C6K0_9EURO|nr:hypothetical protein BO82DRAFT_434049 [Aspergillus uvarum CBS 121591]PYH79529.1 hypothetical protein BO82DRAFT_434049 [Aspergillus uvarum CBS 121591]
MEDPFSQYIKIPEPHRRPNAPIITISLRAADPRYVLNPTSLGVRIHTHRASDQKSSKEQDQPCILDWTGVEAGLLLFRHLPTGKYEPVTFEHIDSSTKPQPPHHLLGFSQLNIPDRWVLAPGNTTAPVHPRIERHAYHGLQPGERYEILWPGAEIPRWALRDVREATAPEPKAVPLVVPGGARCSFMLEGEREPAPMPRAWSPPPLEQTDRVPGAPVLTVELKATTSHWNPRKYFPITWTITYHGTAGREDDPPDNPRPITFRAYNFRTYGTFRAYRQRYEDGEWESYDEDGGYTFPSGPDDPHQVNVGKEREKAGFISLRPGQTYSRSVHLYSQDDLPRHPATGEILRYRFKGCVLDWWDWGTLDNHVDTVVTVPGFLGGEVLEPSDNGGRARAVVPASNLVELTVV